MCRVKVENYKWSYKPQSLPLGVKIPQEHIPGIFEAVKPRHYAEMMVRTKNTMPMTLPTERIWNL